MEKRVVITGMGVISPVGNRVSVFWDNLTNGVCGIGPITQFVPENLPVKFVGEVLDFNAEEFGVDKNTARRADRFTQFALAAAQQAIDNSKIKVEPERFGVYIGSGVGGIHTFTAESKKMYEEGPSRISPLFIPMMISNIAAGNVAIVHHAEGPCLPVVTACATGTHAIGEAYRAIKHGYADAIIAGGTEASISPLAIGGFTNAKALSRAEEADKASLPFDKRRQGFVLSEGAGIVILEEYEHAKARNAEIYAEVCGYGNSCDAYHYTAPKPDGKCAARAMKMALEEAKFTEKDRLYINAHGTSTPLNDPTETAAIKLALGEKMARKVPISSTKSMTGHMLGAAGAVELIASVMTLRTGIVHPTIGLMEPDPACDLDYVPLVSRSADINMALSSSLGFGGHNGSIVIRRMDD